MFADRVLDFYKSLKIRSKLPRGVEVLNPYQDPRSFALVSEFYQQYYGDNLTRTIILGINPGRFGAGLTGIPFVDPVKLQEILGIKNDFPKKTELSADFIQEVVNALGGPKTFYSKFFINSVSPLGFTAGGKNLNYYDSSDLQEAVAPFILKCIKTQLDLGISRDIAYCLGEGKNFSYLQAINVKHRFFREIIPLPHPRFVMQYKRKLVADYIADYVSKLSMAIS